MRQVVIAKDPDEVVAKWAGLHRWAGLLRPRLRTRLGHDDVRKIDRIAWSKQWFGDVKSEPRAVVTGPFPVARHAALPLRKDVLR
jgi:hypothetical protein